MTHEPWPPIRHDRPATYVIRVRGRPSAKLTWESRAVRSEPQADKTTILTGRFADQADVLGFLAALVDAGHEVISIECLG